MKRLFDLIFAIILLILLAIPMLIIATSVRLTSRGPSLHWSNRVGRNNVIYKMPKFRSMILGTPEVATHLLDNPDSYLSPIGILLRSTSLDELPQLFSIIKGDMSFVGPRPALYNQFDLISLRKENGVDKLLPGITGIAQVNGRDKLSIPDKVKLDLDYMKQQSFLLDIKILYITFLKVIKRDGISS